MSFIWPTLLLSLLILLPLVALYLRMGRRRRDLAARYGGLGLIGAAGRPLGWRRHVPPALFLLALALLCFSLARPQTVVSLPRVEGIVILAFDVSGSMAADDLKPTRMEAAKVAARSFVGRQPPLGADRRRLIQRRRLAGAAADERSGGGAGGDQSARPGARHLPLERDPRLAERDRPRQWSAGSEFYTNRTPAPTAVPTAVPRGTYTPAAIVLLTDGENTAPPGPSEAATAAAERGVRIYPVGIGSAAGAPLKIEGFVVQTRLDEATLKQIAQRTDGTYYNAVSEDQLQKVYENLSTQLVIRPERTEVTALFAGIGLLALLLGGVFSALWLGRIP
jgi:Ca-activated chloride channel family protein